MSFFSFIKKNLVQKCAIQTQFMKKKTKQKPANAIQKQSSQENNAIQNQKTLQDKETNSHKKNKRVPKTRSSASVQLKINEFNGDEIPLEYIQLIAHSQFCERDGVPFVRQDYLTHQITDPGAIVFVALDGTKLCGFLIGFRYWHFTSREEITFDEWTLDIVCRDPEEKYKGIGDVLIETFLMFAKASGMDDVQVHATSKATRKIYERHGLRRWKDLGENDFQMAVKLSVRQNMDVY